MASKNHSKKRRKARRDRTVQPEPAVAEKPAASRRPRMGEDRPPPIWGNVPVTQVAVLGGLVLLVLGMVNSNVVEVVVGLALGSVGGLELSLREHFTGYRSHTTLLAGTVFMVVVAVTFLLAQWVLWLCLVTGLVFALPAAWLLLEAFKRASGGMSYRVR